MDYNYDANGRMVKATKTSVPDALSVYDASGMRVAEKVNDVWRFLIYDIGGKLVAEYGGLQSTDEGGVKYLLQDWQGSTRAVLSNSGFVNGRSDYSAYGEDIGTGTGLRTAAQGFGNANAPRQKYGLTERDDATGLDHTWFRKNENRAGRWTSPDPYNGSASLGNPQSFNRYSYVENQPTNFVDPSGLNAEPAFGSACTSSGGKPGVIDHDGRCKETNVGGSVNVPWGDPWTLTGNAAILYLWNPTGRGGSSVDSYGLGGGTNGIDPVIPSAPSNDDKNKKYKACVKAETRNCEAQGRAYFNDNFYSTLLWGPAAGAAATGIFAAVKKAGWWGAIKMGVGTVAAKAGPYVTVVTSAWAIRDLAKAGEAIENGCKTNIDELCRRRAGLL